MIASETSFETNFSKPGSDIIARGNIRSILSLLILYFREVNNSGYINSHHGSTILLSDYPLSIRFGAFGQHKKHLGLIFESTAGYYGHIFENGNSQDIQRPIYFEARKGIFKILTDEGGPKIIKDKWNHNIEYTSMSVVLNIPIKWHEVSQTQFKKRTKYMVSKLNIFAKALNKQN